MYMMTSSNGNIFRVTGPLCGEFTGHRWILRPRPVTRMFFFYLRLNKRLSKQSWGWWFETPSCPLWRHSDEGWCFMAGQNMFDNSIKSVKYLCDPPATLVVKVTSNAIRCPWCDPDKINSNTEHNHFILCLCVHNCPNIDTCFLHSINIKTTNIRICLNQVQYQATRWS